MNKTERLLWKIMLLLGTPLTGMGAAHGLGLPAWVGLAAGLAVAVWFVRSGRADRMLD